MTPLVIELKAWLGCSSRTSARMLSERAQPTTLCTCCNRNYFTDDTAGRFRDDMFNPLAVLHLVLYIDGLICIIVQEPSKSIVCIAALCCNFDSLFTEFNIGLKMCSNHNRLAHLMLFSNSVMARTFLSSTLTSDVHRMEKKTTWPSAMRISCG